MRSQPRIVECLGESLGALGLEDKVVVEPAKVEPSPSNGRKRRPSTASASGKKRRKTVIIDMLQQPDSFEQAAVEIKKLFQHCRDCHHNADDHREGGHDQFGPESPCRLSVYWKSTAVGLKVKLPGGNGEADAWPQIFYISTPVKCIQASIYCATQLVSWLYHLNCQEVNFQQSTFLPR